MPIPSDEMKVPATFDMHWLLDAVFAPTEQDVFAIFHDTPHSGHPDNDAWRERRDMALDWHARITAIGRERGFDVLPVVSFPAVPGTNADLPVTAMMDGDEIPFNDILERATVVLAMMEVSVTGPLIQYGMAKGSAEKFRVASMPVANRSMEDTCYLADPRELVAQGETIRAALAGAEAVEVTFSTGDVCTFDIRHREIGVDNGYLHPDKQGFPVINLPSGEVWVVPYEGERDGDPSRTQGVIPVAGDNGDIARFKVAANRVVEVLGDGPRARSLRADMDLDATRRNVAEIAFGYNRKARVTGVFIEDEKAGFHWGYGRSEFLGGTVSPADFAGPETVLHVDLPYAKTCPITVSADLISADGARTAILRDGDYVI